MNAKDDFEQLFDIIFSSKLKEQRTAQNLTQTAAADKFNNFRQWIGKMESGNTTPTLYMLYRYTSSNGLDLLRALQEAIDIYEVKCRPLQALADKKKAREYLNKIKSKKERV